MEHPTPQQSPAETIVLVRDLMFSSRISNAAKALGVPVRMLRDPAILKGLEGKRVLADLNQEGVLDAAAEWRKATGGVVTGFVSHVDADTIARAREAGLDHVLARSQFVKLLPELLRT